MEQLINVILVWLSLRSDLPLPHDHPKIKHVSPQHLVSVHYGAALKQSGERNVMGVYDARRRKILLRDDWDSRNPVDVSILVHELVHYMQDLSLQKFECSSAREAPAYAAPQRWLALFGADLRSAFGIDAMTLKLRTTCLPN